MWWAFLLLCLSLAETNVGGAPALLPCLVVRQHKECVGQLSHDSVEAPEPLVTGNDEPAPPGCPSNVVASLKEKGEMIRLGLTIALSNAGKIRPEQKGIRGNRGRLRVAIGAGSGWQSGSDQGGNRCRIRVAVGVGSCSPAPSPSVIGPSTGACAQPPLHRSTAVKLV